MRHPWSCFLFCLHFFLIVEVTRICLYDDGKYSIDRLIINKEKE